MGSSKNCEGENLKYIKSIVSEVMGEDIWSGFYDVVTTSRPRIDMYDSGSTLVVVGEIPGILDPKDLSISVVSNKLTLKGISKDKYLNNRPGRRIKSECLYGSFNRTIELPYEVDEEDIFAVYENGMLEITMQRTDIKDEKTIQIEFKK